MLKSPYNPQHLLMSHKVVWFGLAQCMTRMFAVSILLHQDGTKSKGRGIHIYYKQKLIVWECQDRQLLAPLKSLKLHSCRAVPPFSVVASEETQILQRPVVTTQPNERLYIFNRLGLREILDGKDFIIHRQSDALSWLAGRICCIQHIHTLYMRHQLM